MTVSQTGGDVSVDGVVSRQENLEGIGDNVLSENLISLNSSTFVDTTHEQIFNKSINLPRISK